MIKRKYLCSVAALLLSALLFGCSTMLLHSTDEENSALVGSVFPHNAKRILFIGDSITYDGHYVNYIEAYIKLTHPSAQFEIFNLGLPSETVSGLSEPSHLDYGFARPDLASRAKSVLAKVKPDLVFVNYGINDGIYMPFDESRFKAYQQGMTKFHQQVIDLSIPIIHIAAPIYDDKKDPAYASVMHQYADWLLAQREQRQWQVIDGHWPMQKYLDEKRKTDSQFKLAPDAIHPNRTGHGIIAKQVLAYLGFEVAETIKPGDDLVAFSPIGKSVLRLVEKKQAITKDAWLTYTGHDRPGMNKGLPLEKALAQNKGIEKEIMQLF